VAHAVLGPKLRTQQLTPQGRCKDIAATAVFVLSDDAAFIIGTELPVEGGALRRSAALTQKGLFEAEL
jgi:hypothetical protein